MLFSIFLGCLKALRTIRCLEWLKQCCADFRKPFPRQGLRSPPRRRSAIPPLRQKRRRPPSLLTPTSNKNPVGPTGMISEAPGNTAQQTDRPDSAPLSTLTSLPLLGWGGGAEARQRLHGPDIERLSFQYGLAQKSSCSKDSFTKSSCQLQQQGWPCPGYQLSAFTPNQVTVL